MLLDECVTRHLKREFANHEVHTVEEAGFKGLENGNLLRAASGTYDVLITVDRNLPHQQNLTGIEIAVLILCAKKNSYVRLRPLMPKALNALETIQPGAVILIAAD